MFCSCPGFFLLSLSLRTQPHLSQWSTEMLLWSTSGEELGFDTPVCRVRNKTTELYSHILNLFLFVIKETIFMELY